MPCNWLMYFLHPGYWVRLVLWHWDLDLQTLIDGEVVWCREWRSTRLIIYERRQAIRLLVFPSRKVEYLVSSLDSLYHWHSWSLTRRFQWVLRYGSPLYQSYSIHNTIALTITPAAPIHYSCQIDQRKLPPPFSNSRPPLLNLYSEKQEIIPSRLQAPPPLGSPTFFPLTPSPPSVSGVRSQICPAAGVP